MNSETRILHLQTSRFSNILLIVLASLVTYLNAINVGLLALDDGNLVKFLSTDFSIKDLFSLYDNRIFRPLVNLSFLLDFRMFGLNPGMFHLVNVFLHIINALLVYYLAFELLGDCSGKDRYALIAALFFALHPINAEAVLWVSARGDLLSCLFFLLTLILLVKKTSSVTPFILVCLCASYLCALLAKESSISLLMLAPFYFIDERKRIPGKNTLTIFATLCLSGLIYFYLRNGISGSLDNGLKKVIFNHKSVLTLCLDSIAACGFYLWKMVYPLPLNFTIATIDRSKSLIFFLISISALAILFNMRKDTRLPILVILTGFALPIAVLTGNLTWVPYAERFLYIPLTGLSLVIALMLSHLPRKVPYRLVLAGVLLMAVPTALRVNVWADPIAFWQDSVIKSPQFATPRLILAAELNNKGEHAAARRQLQSALEIGLNRDVDRQYAMQVLQALNLPKVNSQ
jgi:protein O-mannosyl-transferase